MHSTHVIVAGAGIAGLGAALALARQGTRVTVLEQAAQISEVGAGLQLGPNAVRVLDDWGLMAPLQAVAAEPERLRFLDAVSGRELARLALGAAMRQRYGWPNFTVRRADLQNLLLQAVRAQDNVDIQLGQTVARVEQGGGEQVSVYLADGGMQRADALVGCDGVRSRIRAHLRPGDGMPRPTGHIAWRTLIPLSDLPAGVRPDQTSVWVAPRLHTVAYPVQGGQTFNVVIFTHTADEDRPPPREGDAAADDADWDQDAQRHVLQAAVASAHPVLRALVDAAPQWRRWLMYDRPALLDPRGYAQGRVALLGDAAHPMRPHLAQGAAMGLEDAQVLGHVMQDVAPEDIAPALARYADLRWRRNAHVQLRAQFNGMVLQSGGLLRRGRNLVMAVRGEKLLDMPWLYGFKA